MRVLKRDGSYESVSFDKVLNRVRKAANDKVAVNGVSLSVPIHEIAQKVCARIFDGVKTSELDELTAQMCSSLIIEHPDYGVLAARIIISNHHKKTSPSFSETICALYSNVDIHGTPCPLVTDNLYNTVMTHKEKLNSYIDYSRDYTFDFFGFKTLERSYLTRINGVIVERPQHMWMRVSLGIHGDDIREALMTYDALSLKYFTHATPTLFNAGTRVPQNSSCFLIAMDSDSVFGMYETLRDCAMISKYAGGIGVHIHNIRAKNSMIRGTNGTSNGIIPMLRVFNAAARHIDQAGRRAGSIAIYLEPWHADIQPFLDLKKNHGAEEERARDLFYALWISDLFMERVEANGTWSLMCPDECPGLADAFGEDFKTLYEKYEAEGRFRKQIKAQDLWFQILQSQIETGTPYMLYKDSVNMKTNQKNLGTIKSSNLCSEIVQHTNPNEIAVCNLSSICLPTYVKNGVFDFAKLHDIVKMATKNLNKIIDGNLYPVEKAERSNFNHRPIGIGVQGLADTFALMKISFESADAAKLNRDIFETMYHASVEQSMEISKKREELLEELRETDALASSSALARFKEIKKHLNLKECERNLKWPGAYSSFEGSPASKGILQFDLWNHDPTNARYDWTTLKNDIMRYGMRNSLLLAPMPTASTSQIMGFNEAFEPFTSNIYKRKTMAGEFIIVNKYLMKDLLDLELWNKDLKEQIMICDGSIQSIEGIPLEIRERYKTVWEIKQKTVIDMSAERGVYVCQSQSMNLFMESPDYKKLSSMHFYAWKKGLKTGMYYLRTKPKAMTQQFTIDPKKGKSNRSDSVSSAVTPVATPLPLISTIDNNYTPKRSSSSSSSSSSSLPVLPRPSSPTPLVAATASIAFTSSMAVAPVNTDVNENENKDKDEDDGELQAVGCTWKPGCKTCSS
jgi:ribonucleoside-diphosphate reductase alpha subunit